MERIVIAFLLFDLLLYASNCAEVGLVHKTRNISKTNEIRHFQIFRDGFLLDDEEALDENSANFSVHKNIGEKNFNSIAPEDLIPMADPEADTDNQIKFEDYTIPTQRIKQPYSIKRRSKRYVWDDDRFKWDNGVIPYIIYENYTEKQFNIIYRAMALWENNTCIRFVEHTDQLDYLDILPGASCYSYVGKAGFGGAQKLSLPPNCFNSLGTAVHELGHAIGLFHEHSRHDRKHYIKVNRDNIDNRFDAQQFEIINETYISTLGLPYDYNSIMHYNGNQGAQDASQSTIEANDPNIIVGKAIVPSRLDILKVNIHYQCKSPFPPRTTHWTPLPPEEVEIPPRPHECGGLILNQLSGAFSMPHFPKLANDQCCSWQIVAPKGYNLTMNITSFGLSDHYRATCEHGNITMLQLDSTKRALSRICRYQTYDDRLYFSRHNKAHIMYCSGKPSELSPKKGFSLTFTTTDINECERDNECSHKCINTPGGYACACNYGYYLSADAHTCFDINECSINNSLCEHKCRNYGGYYKCICPDESIQTESSCNASKSVNKTSEIPPTTIPPTSIQHTTMKVTTKIHTTLKPTTLPHPTPLSTTMQASNTFHTETKIIATTIQPIVRTTHLTEMLGNFTSPNWPETYPTNQELQWIISCPSNYIVELDLRKDPFGIAGDMPDCHKDYVQVHDGDSLQGNVLGKFCHFGLPPVLLTTSNIATVKFYAGPQHSPSRRGFSASYKCIYQCPTLQMPSLPQCGSHMKANSGVVSSPNWPNTYNVNEQCEWIVELPDCQKVIEIEFASFSVAGEMPSCPKDQLYIDDGLGDDSQTHGPFCHLSLPPKIRTTSNVARFRFNAGPQHGALRMGFSAHFQAVNKLKH